MSELKSYFLHVHALILKLITMMIICTSITVHVYFLCKTDVTITIASRSVGSHLWTPRFRHGSNADKSIDTLRWRTRPTVLTAHCGLERWGLEEGAAPPASADASPFARRPLRIRSTGLQLLLWRPLQLLLLRAERLAARIPPAARPGGPRAARPRPGGCTRSRGGSRIRTWRRSGSDP